MDYLVRLVLLFFIYGFLGWCVEVTLKFIQYRRFINRGFLTGPICPIYGAGAGLITIFAEVISPLESSYGTTFVMAFFLFGALEYLTSYVMEKLFYARWWDYSQRPMNLHGRIWIGNLLLFGLGGVFVIHLGNPLLSRLLALFSYPVLETAAISLTVVFAADYVNTHFILKLLKIGVRRSQADNTEDIKREIRVLFSDRNIFYRRFAEAYPEVAYRTERINARLEAIRLETERLRREMEQQREKLAKALESPTSIRNSIIDKQSRLIDIIYDEDRADEAASALKKEIDEEVRRLNSSPFLKLGGRANEALANKRQAD